MGASTIVRVRNGETVNVRTGVLRGAGPQGPMGVAGPIGPQGPAGVPGPAGSINDGTGELNSSSTAVCSSSGWTNLALDNQVLTTWFNPSTLTTYTFQVAQAGNYLVVIRADFALVGSASSGARKIQLITAGSVVVADASTAAVTNDVTKVRLASIYALDPSQVYTLQGLTEDPGGSVNCTSRSVKITKLGAGPLGVQGPTGPTGPTGPQGPQGVAGSASSGFSTFNAVKGAGADTTLDPTGWTATADQGITVPQGATAPHTPFFLTAMATFLERRIISRFASSADLATRRSTRNQGEIYTQLDTGVLLFHEKNGVETNVARVIFSTSAPPSGTGQAAPGVLWVQTS